MQDARTDHREGRRRDRAAPSNSPKSTSTPTRRSPRPFSVQSIPAVFAIHDGPDRRLLRRGACPESAVREFVERLAPGASKVDQARGRGRRGVAARGARARPHQRRRRGRTRRLPSSRRSTRRGRERCSSRSRTCWRRRRSSRAFACSEVASSLTATWTSRSSTCWSSQRPTRPSKDSAAGGPRRARTRGPALRVVPATTRQSSLLVRVFRPAGAARAAPGRATRRRSRRARW